MTTLITGGTGYIGSHIVYSLVKRGDSVIVVDNLSRSKKITLEKIQELTKKCIQFHKVDINDYNKLEKVFQENEIKNVIHLAGFKSVSESVIKPSDYMKNNYQGSINLFEVMKKHKVYELIFSSSATVYGEPKELPITEDHPRKPLNPYGLSKNRVEEYMLNLSQSNDNWKLISLRYFNPLGANIHGFAGDFSFEKHENIMPKLLNAYLDKSKFFEIYGNDYDTEDGSGIRDYIHIEDLVEGHVCALNHLKSINGFDSFNLGTGMGYSVYELIRCFESTTKQKLPIKISPRRVGDIAKSFASSEKARKFLNWKAEKNLESMIQSAIKFAIQNV